MEKLHAFLNFMGQNTPPWIGVAVGHLASNVTLANIAFVTAIAYNVVNTWAHFRKKHEQKD